MTELAYFLDPFKDQVIYSAISRSNTNVSQAKFIRHFNPQIKNTIYVGPSREIDSALAAANYQTESITFIACDDAVNLSAVASAHGLNVIALNANMLDIHEQINRQLQLYERWRVALLEVANQTQSIQEIIRAASQLTSSSIYLLNNAFQVVYSTSTDNELTELLSIELNASGRLSARSQAAVKAARNAASPLQGARLEDDNGFEFYCYDVVKDQELFYSLILIRRIRPESFDGYTFLQTMGTSIELMTSNQNNIYWAGEDFKSLLTDIIEMKLSSDDEITRRLSMLSVVPQKFVSFIIIDFETADDFPDPAAYFITQVEDLFPNSNACIINGSIAIMFGRTDRTSVRHGSFNDQQFKELLERYHAYASISTPTSRRSNFRQSYLLTQRIMSLGKRLRPHSDDRIFLFEDYADYLIIDLCYPGFVQAFGHDDMVYLTQPDVIQLFRYDSKYNDNLLDVLYYYCLNDLNIVKTAKAIFMHRNTVAAKLKKIDQLIFEDYTNGEVQQRIIISYKILRYMNLYIQIDLSKHIPTLDYV